MVLVVAVLIGDRFMARTAEPSYTVLRRNGALEIRRYESFVVAETTVSGDLDRASNEGFRRLAGYIFGRNRAQQRIGMTAPVRTEPLTTDHGERIAMTAPVITEARNGTEQTSEHRVSFVMPSGRTLGDLPQPIDPRVTLREVPQHDTAVLRFSGFWSARNLRAHRQEAEQLLQTHHLETDGPLRLARYNPPFSIPWLRRNEYQIELKPQQ